MKFNKNGQLVATSDDVWTVLVITPEQEGRVTSVGPYWGTAGLERAKSDAAAWKTNGCRTVICRVMPPADFDAAKDEDALFGYSANMHKKNNPLLGNAAVQRDDISN